MTTEKILVPDIEQKLTGEPAVEALITALKASAFELDSDDVMLVETAKSLKIDGPDDYARGFDLLEGLADITTRITNHHARFRKPLNRLIGTVREMEKVGDPVETSRKDLSSRLGLWKVEQDRRDRQAEAERQKVADDAAKAAQAKKAEALKRVADVEPDTQLKNMFTQEAQTIESVDVHAAPVEPTRTAPKVQGHVRTTWEAETFDVRRLMAAWLDGKCHLPEADIAAGLQSFLNRQAGTLQNDIGNAYPGVRGRPRPSAVARRSSTRLAKL